MALTKLSVDLDDPESCIAAADMLYDRAKQIQGGKAQAPARTDQVQPDSDATPPAEEGDFATELTLAAVRLFRNRLTAGGLWVTVAIAQAVIDGRIPTGPDLRSLHPETPPKQALSGWLNNSANSARMSGLGRIITTEYDSAHCGRYGMSIDVAKFLNKHLADHVPHTGGESLWRQSPLQEEEPRAASLVGKSRTKEERVGTGTKDSI